MPQVPAVPTPWRPCPPPAPILVDVLNWSDAPGCQEKAAYVLMMMAHKAYGDRMAMIKAGIMSSLLKLTLLGSPLAQKRASRILEILRVDEGKQVSEGFGEGGHECSSVPAALVGGEDEEAGMSEERRVVRQLVQQSLQSNMRRIVRPANLLQDFTPSDQLKALTPRPTPAEPSVGAWPLCTTTRSLSISFQGEESFYQTSHAKATSPSPARKPTSERRRASAAAAIPGRATDQSENTPVPLRTTTNGLPPDLGSRIP